MRFILTFVLALVTSSIGAIATPVKFTWTSTVNYDTYGQIAQEGEQFTATLVFNNGSTSLANQTWTIEDLRSIDYRTSGGWSDQIHNLKLFPHYSGGFTDGRNRRVFTSSSFSTDAAGKLITGLSGYMWDSHDENVTWFFRFESDVYKKQNVSLVIDPIGGLENVVVSQVPLPGGALFLLSSVCVLTALRRWPQRRRA